MSRKGRDLKRGKTGRKEKGKEKAKKDYVYVWISIVLDLLFWVPLINLIALPISIFFGAKAIRNTAKEPDKYGGKCAAIISVIFAAVSFIFAVIVFLMYSEGMINP